MLCIMYVYVTTLKQQQQQRRQSAVVEMVAVPVCRRIPPKENISGSCMAATYRGKKKASTERAHTSQINHGCVQQHVGLLVTAQAHEMAQIAQIS